MKNLLFAILENKKETHDLIFALSKHGINGTVLSSTSLKHVIHEENADEPNFFSLAHLTENSFVHNTTIYFILEDEKLEEVKQNIREFTGNFEKVKGGMFTLPINTYEGSF